MKKACPETFLDLLVALILTLVGTLLLSVIIGAEGLKVKLSKSSCLQPCTLNVNIDVPPEVPLQTELCLRLSNDDTVDSTTCFPISAWAITVELSKIPQGLYGVEVTVLEYRNTQTLSVIGPTS